MSALPPEADIRQKIGRGIRASRGLSHLLSAPSGNGLSTFIHCQQIVGSRILWLGVGTMPIRKYIADSTFDPETIKAMVMAFEDVMTILNIHGRDDPLAEVIAKKIVSLASQRVSDPEEIKRLVIADSEPLRRNG